jgi:hypothetical protein
MIVIFNHIVFYLLLLLCMTQVRRTSTGLFNTEFFRMRKLSDCSGRRSVLKQCIYGSIAFSLVIKSALWVMEHEQLSNRSENNKRINYPTMCRYVSQPCEFHSVLECAAVGILLRYPQTTALRKWTSHLLSLYEQRREEFHSTTQIAITIFGVESAQKFDMRLVLEQRRGKYNI